MKKIISVVKPFTYTQNVFVYDNEEKIDTIITNINDLSNTIFELSEKYKTNQVELIGNAKFGKGIKQEIEKNEMSKFNKNNLNIEWINN
jgi:hypothetical protein